jgi:hypothetical protein
VERSTLRPPQMLDKNATIRQLFLPSYRGGHQPASYFWRNLPPLKFSETCGDLSHPRIVTTTQVPT